MLVENLVPQNLIVSGMHKASSFYCVPLQDFTPNAGRYDIIWVMWCIGHLAVDNFVSFFKRAKVGLKPGGIFVLKENITRKGIISSTPVFTCAIADNSYTWTSFSSPFRYLCLIGVHHLFFSQITNPGNLFILFVPL